VRSTFYRVHRGRCLTIPLECDDGERVELTNKAYGGLLVHTLRSLNNEDMLGPALFPSLEALLTNAAALGSAMRQQSCVSQYDSYCKAVGLRFFKDKSAKDLEVEKGRRTEWLASLPAEEQAEFREAMGEEDDSENGNKKPWFHKADPDDENTKHPDFSYTKHWKEYKDYVRECPDGPMRGPSTWDISKWRQEDKQMFSFDAMDDFSD
jgi:hypothetical protein